MAHRPYAMTTVVLLALSLAISGCGETWPQIADRLNVHRRDIEADRNVDSAYDALHAELSSNNYFGRMYAVTIFRELGPTASRSVPWLLNTLSDSHPVVRRESALALSRFGPASEPAMDALMDVIRRYPDTDAAWFSFDALGNIGHPAKKHLPELRERLKRYRSSNGNFNPGTDSLEKAINKLETSVTDSEGGQCLTMCCS